MIFEYTFTYEGYQVILHCTVEEGFVCVNDVSANTQEQADAVPDDVIESEREDLERFLSLPYTDNDLKEYGITLVETDE